MNPPDPLTEARDPRTSADRLHALASHQDDAVRLALAANPSLGLATIDHLLLNTPSADPDRPLSLTLPGAIVGNAGLALRLLADPGCLRGLHRTSARTLALSPALTPPVWEALHAHPDLAVRLALARSPAAPPDPWGRLAGSSAVTQVNLSSLDLVDADMVALARSPYLRAVEILDLGENWFRGPGLMALLRPGALRQLRWLNLRLTRVGDEAVIALAEAELPHLACLYLEETGAGDRALRALARSTTITRLEELSLCFGDVNDESLVSLAQSTSLAHLRDLSVRVTDVSDAGVAALARSSRLPALATLDLRLNRIGDEGAIALARSTTLRALTSLDLADNQVGDRGAAALARSPLLASLGLLDLSSNPIGEAARQELREAAAPHPGLTLEV